MANKTKNQKNVKNKFKMNGLKLAHQQRKLKSLKKKVPGETEETFLNEDSPVVVEHAFVSHPSREEVSDVLRDLDGFRDWERESRGNALTYGDY